MGLTDPHPSVDYFAPELTLVTETGKVRLAELARSAGPLLVDLTEDRSLSAALPNGVTSVDLVTAHRGNSAGDLADELTALLVRPDGYTAWACAPPSPTPADPTALHASLARWFTT